MKLKLRSFTAALLLAGLSACALGPDYARPELDVPAKFRWQADTQSSEANAFGDLGWWQVYNDPQLQALVRTALIQNFDVRIAASRVEQARATLGASKLAQFPQFNATASGTRTQTSRDFVTPTAPRDRTSETVQLGAAWELDLWGRLRRLSEAARADLLATQYTQQGVIVTLVGDVATAYFTLQSLDQQLRITQRTVETREKFAELTHARHDRGVVSGLDVATAEAQLATAQANIPELERQIAQTEDQLSILLGSNPGSISRGEIPAEAFAPIPAAGLPSDLIGRRPDIQQAEAGVVAANARIGAAKAALFPTISLTASGGSATTDLSNLFTNPTGIFTLGAGATLPLLDAQRSLYQIDLADARKREAVLTYQKTIQGAFRDVSDALIARQKYAEFERAQAAQVDALRRADEIALARYRIGFSSYFDVINAERDLFGAELTLSAARRNSLVSAVQLYRALGGGWQAEQPTPLQKTPPNP